jgi:hypothetical protein
MEENFHKCLYCGKEPHYHKFWDDLTNLDEIELYNTGERPFYLHFCKDIGQWQVYKFWRESTELFRERIELLEKEILILKKEANKEFIHKMRTEFICEARKEKIRGNLFVED